jgi:hypothetical protein
VIDLLLRPDVALCHRYVEVMQMSDNPVDVIEAAIRSAFTSYPKEDDPDWRSPHWIKPEECAYLAQSILLELQAKGFEIVKRQAR